MGQAPCSGGISLRTFNRNFEGRSGTADAQVYLVSPETAALSAITGVLTDPRELGESIHITLPTHYEADNNMVILPASEEEAKNLTVVRGPNIKPFPQGSELPDTLTAPAVLKVGDNITTDHIMPAGAKLLPYRSNIPYMSNFCFTRCDENFPENARKAGSSMIIGGQNYGQGSSREHAALVPLYLGVKAVIAKSFARIHKANLANAGILPLTFVNPEDYDKIDPNDLLELPDIRKALTSDGLIVLKNKTKNIEIKLENPLSQREIKMVLAGGLLSQTRLEQK